MFRKTFLLSSLLFLFSLSNAFGQLLDSASIKTQAGNGQLGGGRSTLSSDMSGDGRFIVFESSGNIATYNPRNADGNIEIFLHDVAQRHIFQLTDTKSITQTTTCSAQYPQTAIKLAIVNSHAQISNDGKWIVFSSNATTSLPSAAPDGTNPGNFDANLPGRLQILQQDANYEIWLYKLPVYQSINLENPIVPNVIDDLSAGTFTQVTNTPASGLPGAGRCQSPPNPPVGAVVASDNWQGNINDDGSTIAFTSNRVIPAINSTPNDSNEEIFIYKRLLNTFAQVTDTNRGFIGYPIYSTSPSLSGDGSRIAFASTGTNPIINMTGGSNPEANEEVYLSDLDSDGVPDGIKRQVTRTTPIIGENLANFIELNTRIISRDGRYIVFSSLARLDGDNGIETGFADFIYDSQASTNAFKRITPRSNDDPSVPQDAYGFRDSPRFARFTNYLPNSNSPSAVIFVSRMNFRPDGIVPANTTDGMNPETGRPIQSYFYDFAGNTPAIKKLGKTTTMSTAQRGYCPASNSIKRTYCTLSDGQSTVNDYYKLTPSNSIEDPAILQFFTGASGLALNSSSPQAQGLMANMLGSVTYQSSTAPNIRGIFANEVSNKRNFSAPLQLRGVSLTIDGIAAPITSVADGQINFVVPKEISTGSKNVVINNNGTVLRGTVQIVAAPQPDLVRTDNILDPLANINIFPTAYGRARLFNVTNPNSPKQEPFKVTSETSEGTVPTKLRLFLTGVKGVTSNQISIKLGNVTVSGSAILTNAVESDYPGIYSFDFEAPAQLAGAGHVPVVVTINGQSSRTTASAPRTRFLTNQPEITDLAVWRPGNGTWYVLDNNGANPVFVPWGIGTDKPAPGDYDGDRKTDFCIFRPGSGDWWILRSSDNSIQSLHFGQNLDDIAQADYDGDGKTDIAVYRQSDSNFYILNSSTNQVTIANLGTTGDKLVPADYDGDGKADLAVWKNSDASFWIKGSIDNTLVQKSYGQPGDLPVIGDYDGDGKADLATWRNSDGDWRIQYSNTSETRQIHWGDRSTDVSVQGDYDGDGITDIAVWRSTGSEAGNWYILKSRTNEFFTQSWGTAGDIPVPAVW